MSNSNPTSSTDEGDGANTGVQGKLVSKYMLRAHLEALQGNTHQIHVMEDGYIFARTHTHTHTYTYMLHIRIIGTPCVTPAQCARK